MVFFCGWSENTIKSKHWILVDVPIHPVSALPITNGADLNTKSEIVVGLYVLVVFDPKELVDRPNDTIWFL